MLGKKIFSYITCLLDYGKKREGKNLPKEL
jgi:hypothetical protein